mgnify:CR=1 FL=1
MNSTQPKPQVMKRLRKALRDPDPRKRRWAIVTLVKHDTHAGGLSTDKKIDSPEAKEAVEPDDADAQESEDTRAAARDRAPAGNLEIPALLLEHLDAEPEARNRLSIVNYLGERRYAPARSALEQIANRDSEGSEVRKAARAALEALPDIPPADDEDAD